MTHWLLHILGMDNASGTIYLAWSGWGGDVGELAVFSALVGLLRKHNCHVQGCLRLGRHAVEGTAYVVCRRHHPEGAPTAQDVARTHRHLRGGERP